MPLPDRVRVKLSSEAAEAISLTRVVVQDMPLHELIEHALAISGKDRTRIRETLRRGTLLSGASRFRWDGWEIDAADLESLLAAYPDPDPSRPFDRSACVRAILRGARPIEVPRDAASRHGLLRRANFWDRLMEIVAPAGCVYDSFSYRDRADVYRARLEPAAAAKIREAAALLRFATLRERVRRGGYDAIDLFTPRGASAARPR
jgi:hypothetical protein